MQTSEKQSGRTLSESSDNNKTMIVDRESGRKPNLDQRNEGETDAAVGAVSVSMLRLATVQISQEFARVLLVFSRSELV